MHTFLTILYVVSAVLVVGAAWVFREQCKDRAAAAQEFMRAAAASEARLKILRSDVSALTSHVHTLETQLQRVQGRVYRQGSNRDVASALRATGEPQNVAAADGLEAIGQGLAAPDLGKVCRCGYCEVCLNGPTAPVNGAH